VHVCSLLAVAQAAQFFEGEGVVKHRQAILFVNAQIEEECLCLVWLDTPDRPQQQQRHQQLTNLLCSVLPVKVERIRA